MDADIKSQSIQIAASHNAYLEVHHLYFHSVYQPYLILPSRATNPPGSFICVEFTMGFHEELWNDNMRKTPY